MTDETIHSQPRGQDQASAEPVGTKKKEKTRPEGLVIPDPKPKLSKAERRALQEAQRAAKASGGGKAAAGFTPGKIADSKPQPSRMEATSPSSKASQPKGTAPTSTAASTTAAGGGSPSKSKEAAAASSPTDRDRTAATVPMVSHLQPPLDGSLLESVFSVGGTALTAPGHPHLHPAAIRLGYDYAIGRIRGGNARCRAMLECFGTIIRDFVVSTAVVDPRAAIDQQILKPSFSFWSSKCRPHSVSMGNAITFLKAAVAAANRDLSLGELQSQLVDTIKAYRQERIDLATTAIAECLLNAPGSSSAKMYTSTSTPTRLLSENDVVLVYGSSEAIALALRQGAAASSRQKRQKFARVVVADSPPLWEGRATLQSLRDAGVDCTYVALDAISYVMPDVTKVLLGASALMSDGSVLGRSGSATVALVAHSHRVPVLVCAETYKISNRVQLESVTMNELGGDYSCSSHKGVDHRYTEAFKRLHLLYDLTPSQFVSGIVTELGIVPPTSVAVLLREMNPHDVTRK